MAENSHIDHGAGKLSFKKVTDKFDDQGHWGPLKIYPKTFTELGKSAPPGFVCSFGSFPDVVHEKT